MKTNYCYIVINDGTVYSSRIKAHKRVCNLARENEDDFLPIKESKKMGYIEILYSGGYMIHKKIIL